MSSYESSHALRGKTEEFITEVKDRVYDKKCKVNDNLKYQKRTIIWSSFKFAVVIKRRLTIACATKHLTTGSKGNNLPLSPENLFVWE